MHGLMLKYFYDWNLKQYLKNSLENILFWNARVTQIKIFCMAKFSAGLKLPKYAINIIWNHKMVYFYIHIWRKNTIYGIFSIGNLKVDKHFYRSVIKANAVGNMLCKTFGEISYEMNNLPYLFFKKYT